MANLTNRNDLIEYVLRKLGHPVIQINVSEEQVNDRIDDAIQFNVDYNYNMIEKKFLSIKITQTDIDNNYVEVPEDVLAVQRLLPIRSITKGKSADFLFDVEYHLTSSALFQMYSNGDVSQFYLTKQYLATINDIFNNQPMYEFRRYTDKVYFKFDASSELSVDDFVVLEVYTPIDSTSRFWNDRLIKDYATALVKKQWATNLSKYQNVELPGGVKLNGAELYNQAIQEIQFLEEEIKSYSEPVEVIVG